jgi:hypothetical protein
MRERKVELPEELIVMAGFSKSLFVGGGEKPAA